MIEIEKFGFGQPVPRDEDPRLLTGRGAYVDDVSVPGQGYGYFLRSPHAHADIRAIDIAPALKVPGVIGVLTGADVKADGLGSIPCMSAPTSKPGTSVYKPDYPLLADGRVRHVGDAVALVVARTLNAAKDGAEAIAVAYAPLPAVTEIEAALDIASPAVWDGAHDNICYEFEQGDAGAVEKAFEGAHHVTTVKLVNNRVAANTMEGRAALGVYDRNDGRYTLHTSMQGPHGLRRQLAERILHVPENDIRVVCKDIGGSFGIKGRTMYREYALVLWAARRLGLPVKWIADRAEGLASDFHGRDHVTEASLALDADGNFLGLKVRTLANMGAYLSNLGAVIPASSSAMVAGTYKTPAIYVDVTGVFTHTSPTSAYRGAGRPEAIYVIERVVDAAAREMGIDPGALRKRNCIPPEAMPFKTPLGATYDSGEFAANIDRAAEIADWAGFSARRASAEAAGKLRGIGMASYIERCAGIGDERAELRFAPSGAVTLIAGAMSNGQGHETVFPHMVSRRLGIPRDQIAYVAGDTDKVYYAVGTGGSRTALMCGSALIAAIDKVIAKGRLIAAHILEAAEADIEFDDGSFRVAGTDRALTMTEIAQASFQPAKLPPGMEPGLQEAGTFVAGAQTFPNGCHVCEVEIDPATGALAIIRYSVIDDVGMVLNPLLMAGQIHGGVAQGVGQALMEELRYDAESGQLVTGSFMDYAMPRADDMVSIETNFIEVPCATNALGLKGGGEAGTVGALPAVVNAVIDALWPLGIRAIDMPVTPERLWRAIRDAGAQ